MRLIDADALIEFIVEEAQDLRTLSTKTVGQAISKTPTVDAVPVVHGKWIYSNEFHWYTASCNKCGYQRRTDIKAEGWNQWKFCPNCGAKMDEGGGNETD